MDPLVHLSGLSFSFSLTHSLQDSLQGCQACRNCSHAGHTKPSPVTIVHAFLPPFLLPLPYSFLHHCSSHTFPKSCSQGFPEAPEQNPLPSLLSQHGWQQPCRAAKWVLLGRRGVPTMQLCLGTDTFRSLSVTEGVVSKTGTSHLEKSFWRKQLSCLLLSSSSCAFSFYFRFFFPLVHPFCRDCFQPDELQLATLPSAHSC